jgi:malonyl-CoA O-methyltransferase
MTGGCWNAWECGPSHYPTTDLPPALRPDFDLGRVEPRAASRHLMNAPDRNAVARMFRRVAPTFSTSDFLYAEIRARLLERLDLVRLEPGTVLDLGAGPGAGAAALAERFPAARVLALDLVPEMLLTAAASRGMAVCGDASRLPLASASVDLAFCNLMLPWCAPEPVFAEIHRVLRYPGLFAFTTVGPDTFRELRRLWPEADQHSHVPEFADMHVVGDALVRAGLAEPVMATERLTLTYADFNQLVRDFRAMGATNLTAGRNRGLTGRAAWARLAVAFDRQRDADSRVSVSIEVILGHAWAPQPRDDNATAAAEVSVPIDRIRRPRP